MTVKDGSVPKHVSVTCSSLAWTWEKGSKIAYLLPILLFWAWSCQDTPQLYLVTKQAETQMVRMHDVTWDNLCHYTRSSLALCCCNSRHRCTGALHQLQINIAQIQADQLIQQQYYCMLTHSHTTQIHVHTYIHTYMHTYIHTCTYIQYIWSQGNSIH